MLQAKYKAHRFVNIIFYLIVFLVGFYIGSIGKRIKIEDLLSQLLFIDNVSATYNQPSFTHTYENDIALPMNFNDSEYIYNLFQSFKLKDGFAPTIKDYYKYVIAFHYVLSGKDYYLYGFNSTAPVCNASYSNREFCGTNGSLTITYSGSNDEWEIKYYPDGFGGYTHYYSEELYPNLQRDWSYGSCYGHLCPTINLYNYLNILSYNPDLFSNDNQMKQVCVDPHKQFAISTQQYYNGNNYFWDYIWFPYFIDGIYEGEYSLEDNLVTYWNSTGFMLNSKENINFYFFPDVGFYPHANGNGSLYNPTSVINQQTTIYPYSNRYSYYGWYALPITFQYNYRDYTSVTTFKFADDYVNTLTYVRNGLIPFTINHYDLTDSSNNNLELCFYINKRYDVSYLEKEGAFVVGEISTPDGNLSIYSSEKDEGFGEKDDYEALFDYLGEFDKDFGLSTIVLAPLDAIYSISRGICRPQTITILNKTINLPCGTTLFWDREDVHDFKIFWNMFWGGIICYNIGISIFKLVHDYKHPSNDRVEVIDL